jgi:hypothetical protein
MSFIKMFPNPIKNPQVAQKKYNIVCTFLAFIFCIASNPVSAQQNQQVKNFNYFKLVVINEQDQMLLVHYKDIWEPAGKKYDQAATIREVIIGMAAEMGVQVYDIKLRAMIGKFYGQAKHPIIFNYVTAKYLSGDLVVPEGCTDIKWFDKNEGIEEIPFKPMKSILSTVFNNDENYLWGGSFRILPADKPQDQEMEIIEAMYRY